MWLAAVCSFTLPYAAAFEVPTYLRLTSGSRIWFTVIEGDLIQHDRTKLGIGDNLGVKRDKLVSEYFSTFRLSNIHLIRLRLEPSSSYEASNDSRVKLRNLRVGYDLDFFMTSQALVGVNWDMDFNNLDTRVVDVHVGSSVFNYAQEQTRAIPSVGLHGTFYPILQSIALRPNLSSRVNWWDHNGLSTWDWELSAGVDIPVNELWTWSVTGGYRTWNVKINRDPDTVDMLRRGFFIETSVLF